MGLADGDRRQLVLHSMPPHPATQIEHLQPRCAARPQRCAGQLACECTHQLLKTPHAHQACHQRRLLQQHRLVRPQLVQSCVDGLRGVQSQVVEPAAGLGLEVAGAGVALALAALRVPAAREGTGIKSVRGAVEMMYNTRL